MWGAILGFFSWLLGRLFSAPPGPSQEAQEAKAAGEATTALGQAQTAASAEQAVAQAEADGPKSQTAVEQRLGDGTF